MLASHLLTILGSLLLVLLAAFVAVMFSEDLCWISPYLGLTEKNEILTFLGIGMGGMLLALQAVIANKRAQAMAAAANAQADAANAQAKATAEQAKANQNTEQGQRQRQRQERLKNAIEHLGHTSDSVRLGGAFELFHLAQDNEDLCQTVMDILCAHIRRTTGEAAYRETHPSKPSEEVQSLLTLLFVQEYKTFKDCHINLQGSWLNGANLTRSCLQSANLVDAYLQRADLLKAKLQGADLQRACLHGADLGEAKLQTAYLFQTQLQGTSLVAAGLQGAILEGAHLQGANLWQARLQGAKLNRAHLQGIHFEDSALSFAERIRDRIGRESESDIAIFQGGLRRADLESLVEGLLNEYLKSLLRETLRTHIGREESFQLPHDSGAMTGAYTAEEAEQWIAEYEEAMLEVPEEGDI